MNDIDLRTKRLCIRPLTLSDAQSLFEYRSLNKVTRFQTFKPRNLTDALNFIKPTLVGLNIPGSWYQLGLFHKDNNNHIGDIGIHFLTNLDKTEIGCTIAPKYWGKGYATEGLETVISFLFSTLKKKRIIAYVGINNVKSRRLFECLGFQLVSQNDSEAIYQLVKIRWL